MNSETIITVRVTPRSSKSEVIDESGAVLRVRIAAPPVDGAANAELVRLLARHFRVPKSSVEIVSGTNSRTKRIRLVG
ncbi:MAG: YggU family protein [Acidobacteria bacterium]|nr:YggU family protein [Acidobacteriota bacterium]MCW5950176.1 YggU family protein [Pyrinomonadaceae bacterium]